MATSEKRPVFFRWKKVDPAPRKAVSTSERAQSDRRKRTNGTEEDQSRVVKDGPAAAAEGKRSATLRDLCTQDKQRVRQLVEQLAAVGEEKEQLEVQIEADRKQFTDLLDQLKLEHKKIIAEKEHVVSELQSSQLQLQQLYTYPGQPAVRSHAGHVTARTDHVTPTTSHVTSKADHLATKAHPGSLPPTPNSNNLTNDRGSRDFTPLSDDWHTLTPSSPQLIDQHSVPLITMADTNTLHFGPAALPDAHKFSASHVISTTGHMTSVPNHITPTTSHMTSVPYHVIRSSAPTIFQQETSNSHPHKSVTSTSRSHQQNTQHTLTADNYKKQSTATTSKTSISHPHKSITDTARSLHMSVPCSTQTANEYKKHSLAATTGSHMLPNASHMTMTTSHMTPVATHMATSYTSAQPPNSQRTSEISTQTVNTLSSSTQTSPSVAKQHPQWASIKVKGQLYPTSDRNMTSSTQTDISPEALTVSDLVHTRSPRKVKGQLQPTSEATPPKVSTNTLQQQSRTQGRNGLKVLTSAMGQPSKHQVANDMASQREQSTTTETPLDTDSTLANGVVPGMPEELSDEVEMLLASALLNAQQTLKAVKSLSSSVRLERSMSSNQGSVRLGEGTQNGSTMQQHGSQYRRTVLRDGELHSTRNDSSTYQGHYQRSQGGNRMSGESNTKWNDSALHQVVSPHSAFESVSSYNLPSPERELTATLNPHTHGRFELAEHSKLHTNGASLYRTSSSSSRSNLNGRRSMCETVDKTRFHSTANWNGDVYSKSGRQARFHTKSGPVWNGLAPVDVVTSTPFGHTRNGLSQKLESQQQSSASIEPEDDLAYVSDILEHAHSLSKRLQTDSSEHAQSMPGRLQRELSLSSEDDTSSIAAGDQGILQELFFI